MKKAWVENGKIRDVCAGDPAALYHAQVAANYNTNVPDNAQNGDLWDGNTLTQPPVVAPEEAEMVNPTVTKTNFLLLFTSPERVKARELRLTDPILNDFWLLLDIADEVHLDLVQVQQGVGYTLAVVKAAGVEVDIPVRLAEILSGGV